MAGVPAAAHTLQILDYLGGQAGPVSAVTIARDIGLPRSSVYHLLGTLSEHNYVTHMPDERRWALGIAAYELGTGYTRQAPLARISRVPLAQLVDRAGHTAHLAVLHGREVIYVLEERGPGRTPLVTDVGVRLPAQLTASGRAMLALLPAAQIRALFPHAAAFALRTDAGPRSPSALRALLVDVRRHGYAVEDGEVSSGFASVAAAVRDHAGHPVAAVALTAPVGDLVNAARRQAAAFVRRAADTVTARIGGVASPTR